MTSTTLAPVLITGATGGLGLRTALELASAGRTVVVGGRRADAVDDVIDQITSSGGSARPFVADLADLDTLRTAAEQLVVDLDGQPLGGIVANAGLTLDRHQESVQGYELTFAVNVLAHQLLLGLLIPELADGGRVVIVASGVHDPDNKLARRAGVPVPVWVGANDSAHPKRSERADLLADTRLRYANSKLANVLQARALQHRLRQAGRSVDVFAVDPGLMVDTDFARSYPRPLRVILRAVGTAATPFVDNMRLSTTSARHLTRLVVDPALAGTGFQYVDGDQSKPPSPDAQNDDLAESLFVDANQLVGLDANQPV
ncbi:MAG: SDR family NAD(P)-dependent oxidoreductase [Actinomycetota bacterium]